MYRDCVAEAANMLKDMRIENPGQTTVSEYRGPPGMYAVFTDVEAIVQTVSPDFEPKSVIGKKCSKLQNKDDPRNDDGNSQIRFYMYVRQPVVVKLINKTPKGHEFINVISIIPHFYTNWHGETALVGFYSLQFPMGHVTIEKFRPPVPLTVKEKFRPDMGELVWFRVGEAFERGHAIGHLHRTFIVREVESKYEYVGIVDVWPIDYVESLREKNPGRRRRRRARPKLLTQKK